jgi:hypothetical protein
MSQKGLAFVAYPGADQQLVAVIREAIGKANSKPLSVRYEPWEFNDISGSALISPIVEKISDSLFVAADITHLNLNVVYEIGYAIGRRKKCFLMRHAKIRGDKELEAEVGIFDTLGYYKYDDVGDLDQRLSAYMSLDAQQFSETLDTKAPIYVLQPPKIDESSTVLLSKIKKARYRYRSFNPSEDSRLSAVEAIRQVACSGGVAIPFVDEDARWADVHNFRAMFVAGLSMGMGKPALLIAHANFLGPLDIRDHVQRYRKVDEIAELVTKFALEVTEYQQQVDPSPINDQTTLQKLRVGEPTAENEMTTLAGYYLETDQYLRTVGGEVNLVVGRKGAGKTAVFIQVRDKTRADKRNIVVDLKPEGFQLIKLKEDLLSYLAEGSRQHLITAFWEYLILLEVAYKLLEKDEVTHKNNHELYELYVALEKTYKARDFSKDGDFSERLLALSQDIVEKFSSQFSHQSGQRLSNDQVTQLLYRHDLRQLREQISKYLEKKHSVWILFDNLDKGWSTSGVDEIDTAVLRCLIDAGRKIERDMRRSGHDFHCVVFVRNDVYERLMQRSADYGKEMRAVLDWNDSDMLRELLRLRLISALNLAKKTSMDQIWRQICVSHYEGEESLSYMIDRSLMRPRNLIKIFNHCKGFANNFGRGKIEADDLAKGMKSYSQDLLMELDRELTDVFPTARDLVYKLLDAKARLSRNELVNVLSIGEDVNDEIDELVNKFIDFLIYYGIIGLHTSERDIYIFHVNYDQKVLTTRVERAGDRAEFVINPAFWPVLEIKPVAL